MLVILVFQRGMPGFDVAFADPWAASGLLGALRVSQRQLSDRGPIAGPRMREPSSELV